MKFHHNKDGSVIVELETPVSFKGQEHQRLTIPVLKAKHLKTAKFSGSNVEIGQMIDWADTVVEPNGILGELSVQDGIEIAGVVANALSKSSG